MAPLQLRRDIRFLDLGGELPARVVLGVGVFYHDVSFVDGEINIMAIFNPKICVSCGKKFRLNSGSQKYCPQCKDGQFAIVKSRNNVFRSMMSRCHDPKSKDYRFYGERGITVCEKWRGNFQAFKKWAEANGFKIGLDIDRKDSLKGYSPYNCRFVTRKENQNNRRNKMTFKNGRMCSVCRIFKTFDNFHGIKTPHAACKPCRNLTRRKGYAGMEK